MAPQPAHNAQPSPSSTALSVAPRVWMDVTGTILGHAGALSPLGAQVLDRALLQFNRVALRADRSAGDPRHVVGMFDGRAWLNLSALRGYLSGPALGRWVGEVDPSLVGRINDHTPAPTDDLRAPHLLPGLVMQGARAMAAAVAGQIQPARAAAQAEAAWGSWQREMRRRVAHPVDARGMTRWVDHLFAPTAHLVVHELMPLIALATTAARNVREPFLGRKDCAPLLQVLGGGLQGHRTTRFLLDAAGKMDQETLLRRHGYLGVRALDVANPRFAEQPAALEMFRSRLPSRDQLEADRDRAQRARKLAVATLAAELSGPLERARFLAAAEVVQELGGLSDWPLDALLWCVSQIRGRLVERAGDSGLGRGGSLEGGAVAEAGAGPDGLPPGTAGWGRLPGTPLMGEPVTDGRAVVSGQARGVLARPGCGPLPDRPVWVLDSLELSQAPWVAQGVACVVSGAVPRGPSVQVAAMLGRPCVCVRPDELPPLGSELEVDGTHGSITVVR